MLDGLRAADVLQWMKHGSTNSIAKSLSLVLGPHCNAAPNILGTLKGTMNLATPPYVMILLTGTVASGTPANGTSHSWKPPYAY